MSLRPARLQAIVIAAGLFCAGQLMSGCDPNEPRCGYAPETFPVWDTPTWCGDTPLDSLPCVTIPVNGNASVNFHFSSIGPAPTCVRTVPWPDPLLVCGGPNGPAPPGQPTTDCVLCSGFCYGSLNVSVTTAGTYHLYFVLSAGTLQATCPFCGIGNPMLVIVK